MTDPTTATLGVVMGSNLGPNCITFSRDVKSASCGKYIVIVGRMPRHQTGTCHI